MNYKILNQKISFIFLRVTFLLFAIAAIAPNFNNLILNDYFCSFLILTIGLSHGALDNQKGKIVLDFFKSNKMSLFYIAYVGFSLVAISCWYNFPTISLLTLLIIGPYHFGKDDCDLFKINKFSFRNIVFFVKGTVVISAPLLFNFTETIDIFRILSSDSNFLITSLLYLNDNNLILFLVLFGFISSIYLPRDFSIKFLLYVEFTSIILLNYLFKPFAAFTIYFCFLHSMRHIIVLNKSLNLLKIKNKKATTSVFNIFNNFYKHAIKLTLISSFIFLSSMFISSNLLFVDDTLLKIIFPGLAALTLPHIILDFLYEKIKTN